MCGGVEAIFTSTTCTHPYSCAQQALRSDHTGPTHVLYWSAFLERRTLTQNPSNQSLLLLPPPHPLQTSWPCSLCVFCGLCNKQFNPVCAQWCIFSIVRANFEKYDLCSAPIARAPPRYIVTFFKFFKTGKCFKTMPFPVSCVSQKPLAFQKHSLLLTHPKTHAKTLSERSEKCATLQVLMGTNSVARAKYLQRALWTLRRALYQV